MLRMSFKMIKKIIPLKADYKMPTQPGKEAFVSTILVLVGLII